jgi:ATP-dependent DNA helicase RecQ
MSDRFVPAMLDGLLDDTTASLRSQIKQRFTLDEIRGWQARAIQALLKGKDVLIKAGTGMGKSLVFQGMALSKLKAIVLVISPLIALMEDQVSISFISQLTDT